MKINNKFWALASISLLVQIHTFAQVEKTEAAFIFNFASFINWPTEYQKGDFEIAVLGASPIVKELETLTIGKKIGVQSIKIKKINTFKELGVTNILFVPNDQEYRLREAAKYTESTPVLVISESEGSSKKGSTINFLFVDNKIKFELNQALAERKGMKLADKLVKLSIPVSN
jgi:hypothetical protein